ncbi:hypothetical protein GY45DRAFT_501994 [Cubamyces sp. BRFM 1775]|nr:hypothetical protein GY45DRAFT_501994 [Cubamyces sp. BRFM 1775]
MHSHPRLCFALSLSSPRFLPPSRPPSPARSACARGPRRPGSLPTHGLQRTSREGRRVRTRGSHPACRTYAVLSLSISLCVSSHACFHARTHASHRIARIARTHDRMARKNLQNLSPRTMSRLNQGRCCPQSPSPCPHLHSHLPIFISSRICSCFSSSSHSSCFAFPPSHPLHLHPPHCIVLHIHPSYTRPGADFAIGLFTCVYSSSTHPSTLARMHVASCFLISFLFLHHHHYHHRRGKEGKEGSVWQLDCRKEEEMECPERLRS